MIEIINLSKTYGKSYVLRDINVTFDSGHIWFGR